MSNAQRNGSGQILKLDKAPPPVKRSDVSVWQASMRAAFMAAATPETTARVVQALVRQAEAGDFAATKLYLAYAVGMPSNADTIELEAGTVAAPGTPQKYDVLTDRARRGEPLFDPSDARPSLD